jgi:hypothetical protein
MEKRRHKAITNDKNPKDHNTRAPHVVQDEKHKGKVANPIPRLKKMERSTSVKVSKGKK